MGFLGKLLFGERPSEEERKQTWRERFTDDATCPHCDEPLGGFTVIGEYPFRAEHRDIAILGSDLCPYCSKLVWLTADGEIVDKSVAYPDDNDA